MALIKSCLAGAGAVGYAFAWSISNVLASVDIWKASDPSIMKSGAASVVFDDVTFSVTNGGQTISANVAGTYYYTLGGTSTSAHKAANESLTRDSMSGGMGGAFIPD